jgi:hypothetical protein
VTTDDARIALFLRVVAGLVSELGGEMIGGTPGAIFTAGSSAGLSYVADHDRTSAQQADELLAQAQRSTGITPEELASRAQSDERLQLLVGVIEASWRTRDRHKLRALSRVLADGITDDARIDVSILLGEACREIETPHLRLLGHMANARRATIAHEAPKSRPSSFQPSLRA